MGKIATNLLAAGDGWTVSDLVCRAGPGDRPFEEQHDTVSVAVVLSGSFRYRSGLGSTVMAPGCVLLGSYGQTFECGHEHGTGDRCLSFQFAPEFFEQAGSTIHFPTHRLPPNPDLAPWLADARLAVEAPERVVFDELAYGMAAAVAEAARSTRVPHRAPPAADERRITAALRFMEARLADALPLEDIAASAGMSRYHFLRVFRHVTGVTPHQYIVRSRLQRAAVRLRTGSERVVDVALDSGFRDLSHFNHAFHTEFGVNPMRYRRG